MKGAEVRREVLGSHGDELNRLIKGEEMILQRAS
jgi:hypothetical protein